MCPGLFLAFKILFALTASVFGGLFTLTYINDFLVAGCVAFLVGFAILHDSFSEWLKDALAKAAFLIIVWAMLAATTINQTSKTASAEAGAVAAPASLQQAAWSVAAQASAVARHFAWQTVKLLGSLAAQI
jgi:hypothetical protein